MIVESLESPSVIPLEARTELMTPQRLSQNFQAAILLSLSKINLKLERGCSMFIPSRHAVYFAHVD